MPDLLIRNVKPETMAWLENQARLHGRSLADEAAAVIAGELSASGLGSSTAERVLPDHWSHDSAIDIREDRDSDHGRDSLQTTIEDARATAAAWRSRIKIGDIPDSVPLIREDRDTR